MSIFAGLHRIFKSVPQTPHTRPMFLTSNGYIPRPWYLRDQVPVKEAELSSDEAGLLDIIRIIGPQEALWRLALTGPYLEMSSTIMERKRRDALASKPVALAHSAADAARSIVVRAANRYEECLVTIDSICDGDPPFTKDWKATFDMARVDFEEAEQALAYAISSSFNIIAPEDRQIDEESEASIGIGVRVKSRTYYLKDVVGNMTRGIIGVSDATVVIDL